MAKHTSMLPHSGKVDSKKLSDIPSCSFSVGDRFAHEPTLYQLEEQGLCLDFLWSPKSGYKNLFVLFSGDVPREKYQLPVFQRWSWAAHFPGNTLYIADPMLRKSDHLGLAWYAGSSDQDPMGLIKDLIASLCTQYDIDERNIVFYGSSGGGFAALRSLLFFKSASAIAINPQTNIAQYHRKKVGEFVKELYPGLSPQQVFKRYSDKTDLLFHAEELASRNIVYAQNKLDTFHVERHEIPFFNKVDSTGVPSRIKKIHFSHEGGHGKAETPNVFFEALQYIEKYIDVYQWGSVDRYRGPNSVFLKEISVFFKKQSYVSWALRFSRKLNFKVGDKHFDIVSGYYDEKRLLNFLTFKVDGELYTILQRLGPCEIIIDHTNHVVLSVDRFPESVLNGVECFLKQQLSNVYQRKNQFSGFLFGGHTRPYHQVYDSSLSFHQLCLMSNKKKIVNKDVSFFSARMFPGDVETWDAKRLAKETGFFLLSCKDEENREPQFRALCERFQGVASLEQERLNLNPAYVSPQNKLVIWLGTSFMKRSFAEQQEFFDLFIHRVLSLTDNVLFVVDGVTATVGKNKNKLKREELSRETSFVERLMEKHSLKGKLISLIGERAVDKLAYACKVDFFVSNALTDSMWCSAFFRKPGVVHYSPFSYNEAIRSQKHYKTYFIPGSMVSSQRKKGKPSPWADYSIDANHLSDICFNGLQMALKLQSYSLSYEDGKQIDANFFVTLSEGESLVFSQSSKEVNVLSKASRFAKGAYEVAFDIEADKNSGRYCIKDVKGNVLAIDDKPVFTFLLQDEFDYIKFVYAADETVSVNFYGVRVQKLPA